MTELDIHRISWRINPTVDIPLLLAVSFPYILLSFFILSMPRLQHPQFLVIAAIILTIAALLIPFGLHAIFRIDYYAHHHNTTPENTPLLTRN